jgi:hypothetical protein
LLNFVVVNSLSHMEKHQVTPHIADSRSWGNHLAEASNLSLRIFLSMFNLLVS